MSTKLRNLIILVIVVILLFVLYKMFVAGDKKKGSELSSSASQNVSLNNETIKEGQEFLNTLNILKNIQLDNTMFTNENEAFVKLVDYSVEIIRDTNPGRENPFAPIGVDIVAQNNLIPNTIINTPINTTNLSISSLPAIEVSRTSAKLRATLPSISDGDMSYFEWGVDVANLSSKSNPYHQIVSPFAYIATGLLPNKKYFYRAVVKNGTVVVNGEIMSFTTLN